MSPLYGEPNRLYTARLATPIELECETPAAAVLNLVRNVVDGYTPQRGLAALILDTNYSYWLEPAADGAIVSCGKPRASKYVVAGPSLWSWRALVQATPGRGGAGAGLTHVTLVLVRWVTRQGRIDRGDAYERFRDRFIEELAHADRHLAIMRWTPPRAAPTLGPRRRGLTLDAASSRSYGERTSRATRETGDQR